MANERLRQLRRLRKWTQEQLADHICDHVEAATGHRPGVSSMTVSKLERGEVTWPNKDTRAALRAIFGVEQDEDLGLHSQRSSTESISTVTLSTPTNEALALLPQEGDDVRRRELLRSALAAGGMSMAAPTYSGFSQLDQGAQVQSERAFVMATAHESAIFGQRIGMTNVRAETLEQIDEDIDRIGRAYLTQSLNDLIAETRYVRNMVFNVLEGRQPPSQGRQLHMQAAQLCGLLASASSDLGHYDAARTHARTAALCAELAGASPVTAWVAATQSLIEFWDDRPTQALQRAQMGQQFATTDVDALRLYSLEARASARLGDSANTRQAIDRMLEIMEHADGVSAHRSIFDFPQANALRCAGSAHLWLGEYPDAQRLLSQALAAFEADPAGGSYAHIAVTRIDLALAQLGNDELEAAGETLNPVLELSPERRLSGAVRRFGEVRAALARPRYKQLTAAKDLAERLKTLSPVVSG